MNAVCAWQVVVGQGQVVTEETWKEGVHAAAAVHDKDSLLALWQWLAQNLHDWNAPNGAAQGMSAHVLAKQGKCAA